MRLTHQLNLLIAILLVLVLLGTLYISIKSSRDYLLKQLHSQTQESADSLAIKLTGVLTNKDTVLANVTAQGFFDHNHYQSLKINLSSGKEVFDVAVPIKVEKVPQWFISLIPINMPVVKAIVENNWKQLANIELIAHPGYAYRELWNVAFSNFIWLSFLAVLSYLVLWSILKIILRPLRNVEDQANAIANKNFSIRPLPPKTPEFKQLVLVMNHMAEKIEGFLSGQAKRINRLRKQVYIDQTTGVLNRNGFEIHLNDLLQNKSELLYGYLILINTEGLEAVNQSQSFQQGNQLLQAFVKRLQQDKEAGWEIARLSGKDFVLVVTDHSLITLDALCQRIASVAIDPTEQLHFYVAGIEFESGQKWQQLMSLADTALSQALKSEHQWYALTESHKKSIPTLTASQWREKLVNDLESSALGLREQVCVGADNTVLHHEILLHGVYQDKPLPTTAILSIAQRCDLVEQIDRYVLEKVMQRMRGTSVRYAVNISATSLLNTLFLNWLENRFTEYELDKNRLILELNEQSLIKQYDILVIVIRRAIERGLHFAFDNVGSGDVIFSGLNGLIPDYIKVAGRYSVRIDTNNENQNLVENILLLARALSIPAIAQHVETAEAQQKLVSLGIDGLQGYHIAKPFEIAGS